LFSDLQANINDVANSQFECCRILAGLLSAALYGAGLSGSAHFKTCAV